VRRPRACSDRTLAVDVFHGHREESILAEVESCADDNRHSGGHPATLDARGAAALMSGIIR
jgi:hypothetical protein